MSIELQPFLAGVSSAHIPSITAAFTELHPAPDTAIIAAGDTDAPLMLIAAGNVIAEGERRTEYASGDIIGEISFFAGIPSAETCRAGANTILYVLERRKLNHLVSAQPAAATELITCLIRLITHRLKTTDMLVSSLAQWGETASRRVITDEMTGIYNRAFLDDAMENFFSISAENRKELSMFMIDIDHCRYINETWGLEAGNRIIVEVVRIIRRGVGGHGIISRYGGDEFAILLPDAGLTDSLRIAESIRTDVERFDFTRALPQLDRQVTISIGVSAFPQSATDLAGFKSTADESLYAAKRNGRNRVESVRRNS